MLVPDENIEGADGAMASARAIVMYFSLSTHAVSKLLEAQRCGMIAKYDDLKPVTLIQDVKTR